MVAEEELDQSSWVEYEYDYYDSDEEIDQLEERCNGFTPFFCTVLNVLQLQNISCCMNENLTLDPQEMEDVCCEATKRNADFPPVILAVIYSRCQNHCGLVKL